ncbi:RNase H domain-containing protein [Trichonephila clavipes]|nr:RNase H domain-containing protein [Trichonephila clavipes]
MAGYQTLSEFECGVIVGTREMGHGISEKTLYVNIAGNEITDSLARAGAGETTTPATPLTYLEHFSKYKAKNKAIWIIPPVHPWYQSKYPGGSLVRRSSRRHQTALTCFLSGHLMSLTFVDDIKHFEIRTECSSAQASPGHILSCWDLPGRTWFNIPYWFWTSSE